MRTRLLPAIAIALLSAPALADDPAGRPVMLDADPEHGACSVGFRVERDGTELRAGPGDAYPVIATLPEGAVVAGCDAEGDWTGVIEGEDETCGIGIVFEEPTPYDGPCRSGWVKTGLIRQIYG
ncbi:hypothetical protein [Oricola sp.]|uniref:hypothetical protein n=1 Tax=Oricola sp. TaxID=1979950 RepID=UPI0025FC5CEF|nr:hypothetical protein [Oricola sp.]MCI5075265.1 hypothetical protein [Oricola sp.]